METIGDRIKELSTKNNLNNNELAEIIGMSGAGIGKYINNQSYPKAPEIAKLASLFKVSTDYLIFGNKKDDLENQLLEYYRELTIENKIKAIGELTKLLTIQKLEG